MAFSQTQLTALEAAIGSGELTLSYDGKTVTYRSMPDLISAYNFVKGQLVAAGSLTASPLSNRGPASTTSFTRD